MLSRIYNCCTEESYGNLGARFYDDFQNMPSNYRQKILINGNKTVELDYGALHPTIIYNMANKELSGDAYDLTGMYSKDEFQELYSFKLRDFVKIVTTRIINSDINGNWKGGFIWSVRKRIAKCLIKKYDYDNFQVKSILKKLNTKVIYDLTDMILEKHKNVKNRFKKNLSLVCQKIDSDICYEILDYFLLKHGICVLPIHDSFIVEEQYEELLREVMIEKFQKITKSNVVPIIKKAF